MIIKITLYTKKWELLKVKQDIIIEGSEIVTYKTLIEISQRIPDFDVNLIVPLLKAQSRGGDKHAKMVYG